MTTTAAVADGPEQPRRIATEVSFTRDYPSRSRRIGDQPPTFSLTIDGDEFPYHLACAPQFNIGEVSGSDANFSTVTLTFPVENIIVEDRFWALPPATTAATSGLDAAVQGESMHPSIPWRPVAGAGGGREYRHRRSFGFGTACGLMGPLEAAPKELPRCSTCFVVDGD